jgi:hypothetical protein
MAQQSFLDFFALPTELRFEVYHIINEANDVPMSAFKGLYQSCRQAKDEMDAECVQRICQTITNAWTIDNSAFVLQLPSSFAAARVVSVTIPSTALPEPSTAPSADIVVIHQLAHLPLDALTITFRPDDGHDNAKRRRLNILFHNYTYRIWWKERHTHAIRAHKMVFVDSAASETDGRPGGYVPCFGMADDGGSWGVIAEEGYLEESGGRPLRRITRADSADIELWEKAWLENKVKSWV